MILNARQIVWTPIIGKDSVAVALNPEFAKACKGYALDGQEGRRIAQHAWENVGNKGPVTPSNFFHFSGNLLLQGVYYKPGAGVWLTLDTTTLSDVMRPVMYHGHNEDRSADDRLWLLHAFGEWATSAIALLNWLK